MSEQEQPEEILQLDEAAMLIIAEMFHAVSILKDAAETNKPEMIASGVSKAIMKYNQLHETGMVEDLLDFRRQFYAKRLT